MVKITKESQKEWKVLNDDKEEIILKLSSSTITNKFHIVSSYIESLSETIGSDFDDWFCNLLKSCEDTDEKYFILVDNIDKLKSYVDLYMERMNSDFSIFVDESKAKKNSILFTVDDIERIIRLSGYLKVYSVISNSENLKLGQRLHKKVYNLIAKDIAESELVYKIFNVIKTKTFRYNITDRYMWDYIKMIQCKSIDVHVVEIFNFIMNYILVLCEEDKNPITYFVSVVEESVKWFLRSVYKSSIVYDDSVSTEDIHAININNLKTYSYNDTLGRLKGIALKQIHDELESETEKSDSTITEFQNRLSLVEYISPLCECLVFPILSELTQIPYNHFKTLTPDHSAVLAVYTKKLLEKTFSEYNSLFSMLDYYPIEPTALATTYKIKIANDHINLMNKVNNFYGFKTKILPHKILCYFVGRISRIKFKHTVSGKDLVGIPLSKIESDIVNFYTYYFAGKFKSDIDNMRKLMNVDF